MKLAIHSSRVVVFFVAAGALAALDATAQNATAPACRTYSAEEVRTLSGAGHGTINQTCRFDAGTFERVCTIRSQATGGSFTLELTDKYASVADFVDEIRVVPPVARIQHQTRRFTSGPAPNAEVAYEYDAARRQTRISTNMKGNLLVMTYDGWDDKGRPTSGVTSSRASTIPLKYAYDDAARTMTITGPAGVEVDTYDADGNMIHETSTDGGGKTEYAIKIVKTDKVCR
jgi:hypothetical protein